MPATRREPFVVEPPPSASYRPGWPQARRISHGRGEVDRPRSAEAGA